MENNICKTVHPPQEREYEVRFTETQLLKLMGFLCSHGRARALNLGPIYRACGNELHKNGVRYLYHEMFIKGYDL